MTTLDVIDACPVPTAASEPPPPHQLRPCLRSIIRRLAVNLGVACVIPAVLFTTTLLIANISTAIVTALCWSSGAIVWRWATNRPVSGLLVLTVCVMCVRTVVALSTSNTFIYFFQPVLTDIAVATVFLASLATARPVVARLAADFYPMDLDVATRPRVRRLFWRLTLMWGFVCLVKGAVSFWLLQSQSLVNFVLIKNASIITVTATATAVTVWASTAVARKEGLLSAA